MAVSRVTSPASADEDPIVEASTWPTRCIGGTAIAKAPACICSCAAAYSGKTDSCCRRTCTCACMLVSAEAEAEAAAEEAVEAEKGAWRGARPSLRLASCLAGTHISTRRNIDCIGKDDVLYASTQDVRDFMPGGASWTRRWNHCILKLHQDSGGPALPCEKHREVLGVRENVGH